MSDASAYYAIRNVQINSTTWTPIVCPIDCLSFSVRCDSAPIYICSDESDPTTQDTIQIGMQEYVDSMWSPWKRTGGCRFYAGNTIAYLKASVGTPTVVLKFVA